MPRAPTSADAPVASVLFVLSPLRLTAFQRNPIDAPGDNSLEKGSTGRDTLMKDGIPFRSHGRDAIMSFCPRKADFRPDDFCPNRRVSTSDYWIASPFPLGSASVRVSRSLSKSCWPPLSLPRPFRFPTSVRLQLILSAFLGWYTIAALSMQRVAAQISSAKRALACLARNIPSGESWPCTLAALPRDSAPSPPLPIPAFLPFPRAKPGEPGKPGPQSTRPSVRRFRISPRSPPVVRFHLSHLLRFSLPFLFLPALATASPASPSLLTTSSF